MRRFLAGLVLALALPFTALALPFEKPSPNGVGSSAVYTLVMSGVEIKAFLYTDWWHYAARLGMPFALAFYSPVTDAIYLNARYWRGEIAHEMSHAFEKHVWGVNRHEVPGCFANQALFFIPPNQRPARVHGYWCSETEVRARVSARAWKAACGTSLYPFGFKDEPYCDFDYRKVALPQVPTPLVPVVTH